MNNNIDRKYLYFWIKQYRRLDDFDESKGYLFENAGVCLSSEYKIIHSYNDGELTFEIKKNEKDYIKNFYSDTLIDIKAFVGNNGSGKTTLLKLISDIISGKDYHHYELEYVLIYADYSENNDSDIIFYKQFNLFKKTNLKISCNKKLVDNEQYDLIQPLTIFYAPGFNGVEFIKNEELFDGKNYKNISTSVLLLNSEESFTNPKLSTRKYYKPTNQWLYYSILEQNRLIDFFLNVGDVFFDILAIPKTIKMQPSEQSIEYAISDLAVKIVNSECIFDIIENQLIGDVKEKWRDLFDSEFKNSEFADYYNPEDLNDLRQRKIEFSPFFKFDEDKLVLDVKKCWIHFYNSNDAESLDADTLIKDLNEQFRIAALMSYIRTFYSNSFTGDHDIDKYKEQLDLKLNLKDLFSLKTLKDASFWKKNKEIERIYKKIERIISMYDGIHGNGFANKDYFRNGCIIFDLNKHKEILKAIHNEYKSIYKLTDFIQFSFTRPMSSGEEQFVRFYSRFFAAMKDFSVEKPITKILFFIDEGELYLHPEWQRKWLSTFINLLSHIEKFMYKEYDINNGNDKPEYQRVPIMSFNEKPKVQLFFATHSPFMLTDLFDGNVVKLRRNDFGPTIFDYSSSKIVAGDINGILKSGFFLNGTLGEFMTRKIDELITRIKNHTLNTNDEKFINNIGNPIMRALLRQELNKVGVV